jgi:GT2 family glycosyltransferase
MTSKNFIVITDFNGIEQTKKCLLSLEKSKSDDFRIILVDHGTDGKTEFEIKNHPSVIRLTASPDLWWAGATNVGIRYAISKGAKTIILLNNDCYVESDTIKELLTCHEKRPAAIISSIQRDWPNRNINVVTCRSCLLLGFPTIHTPTPSIKNSDLTPTKLIIGGRGTLIPVSVFEKIGILDEANLPHYGADHDFYFRARKCGIELTISTRSFVNIDNTRTSSAKNSETMGAREFIKTLFETKSHRNIKHISTLFKKHYPIESLYAIGVFLYISRYIAAFIVRRTFILFKPRKNP